MIHSTLHALRLLFIFGLLSALLIGCGGSEPTMEDEAVTDTGVYEDTQADDQMSDEEYVAEDSTGEEGTEENATQEEADTTSDEQTPAETQPQQEEVQLEQAPAMDVQMQQEMDSVKSENIMLSDKINNIAKENKMLATKVSDLEAALAAAKSAKEKSAPVRYSTAPGKSSSAQVNAYTSAVNLTRQKRYSDAIAELQSLLQSGIKDDYADNCYYWIGECNYQMRKFSDAIANFKLVGNYRFSEKKDDAQIMIAQSYEKMGNREQARDEYKKLIEMYPASEYVSRAKARLR